MNWTHTITFTGTRIGWAEASRGQRLAARNHSHDEPAGGRSAGAVPELPAGPGLPRGTDLQIDADEGQLREAIELVPAGAEAEFRVRIQDDGSLRLEGIALTSPS